MTTAHEPAPALTVQQLRQIFLKPDVSLKVPEDVDPISEHQSIRPSIAIAEHECPIAADLVAWVELWAIPVDGTHYADRWYVAWRVTDDSYVAIEFISFCPYCGLNLDDLIQEDGYYKYVGHDIDDE